MNYINRTVCEKVYSQEGNSPEYKLRSLNHNLVYEFVILKCG